MGSSSVPSKMACWVALLSGIATLLTFNYYQLFWGVQFVFGMSVALATLFLKRGPWGIIITIPVAIATYLLWGSHMQNQYPGDVNSATKAVETGVAPRNNTCCGFVIGYC